MAARMTALKVLLLLCPAMAAAALPDPTALPAPVAAEDASSPLGAPLTAIKRTGQKRVAVIAGQEIPVGGRYEDARVVRITETEVVLRRGSETVVLTLTPRLEKRSRGR